MKCDIRFVKRLCKGIQAGRFFDNVEKIIEADFLTLYLKRNRCIRSGNRFIFCG